MNPDPRPRALLSVSDKTGLADLARGLVERGFELVSTGGTARAIREAGLPVTDVAEVTGAAEMLDGRVKTLHPRIHGGVLANLGDPSHRAQLEELGIEPFSLVVVNLYPFTATVASGASPEECIEQIDIGGPSMVRGAAKNHASVAVVTSPDAYPEVIAAADEVVVLDHGHLDPDPQRRADRRIEADPELFAAIAWDAPRPPMTDPGWLETWRTADLVARAAVDRLLDRWDEPFEGRVARDVGAFIPNGGVLCVGSSTPVRDLDAYLAPRRPPRIWSEGDLVRFVANRGASGIDGFVSTVLGTAAADVGPVYALMGDLTFLHDAGGLLWGARRGHDAVLVVLAQGRISMRNGRTVFADDAAGQLSILQNG